MTQRMDEERIPTIGEVQRYVAHFNELEHDEASHRYDELLDRRDKLAERMVFGSLALNGASVFGLLSVWDKLVLIGFAPDQIAGSAAMFVIGIACAGFSVTFQHSSLTVNAGRQYARMSFLRRIKAQMATEYTEANANALDQHMRELVEHSPRDFDDSHIAMWLRGISGGAWLGAMTYLLMRVAGLG